MDNRDQLQRRVILSLCLLLVAGSLWWYVKPDKKAWLVSVSSGLIVLGVAGVWVSYFAEIQASRQIKSDIDTRFSVLDTILRAKVNDAYFDESRCEKCSCRDEARFRQRLLHELDTCQSEIRILAIAAREFLHAGDGFAYQTVDSFLRRQGKSDTYAQTMLRVALLHPLSEPAVSRAFREDHRYKALSDYSKTRLWSDVIQSCETLGHWICEGYRVAARAYMVAPSCFLIFVNKVVFVEQYHFGQGRERASGKVPILEVAKGSLFYEQLEGHFEYVWRTAQNAPITPQFLRDMEPQDQAFQAVVKYVHRNLLDLAYGDITDAAVPSNPVQETQNSGV